MRTLYGSRRYWLQRVGLITIPRSVNPWNPRWKYSPKRDRAALARLVSHLREVANGIEAHLGETACESVSASNPHPVS